MASSLCDQYLNELKQDSLFQKLLSLFLKKLFTDKNNLLILKLREPMNYQIIYKTEDDKINFNHMTFDEKKKFIVKSICKMTNVKLNGNYCNWST